MLSYACFSNCTLNKLKGIATRSKNATRNKCIASSNKCLTSSNKKLLVTDQHETLKTHCRKPDPDLPSS